GGWGVRVGGPGPRPPAGGGARRAPPPRVPTGGGPIPPPPPRLFGPSRPPPLRRGDRATCLYGDAEVVVTSWTDAPLSWPRCRLAGRRGKASGGGSGLLVCEELARTVRRESAEAIMYWWGVGHGAVARWRKALGVDKVNNPGTNRLVRRAAAKGLKASLRRGMTAEERRRRRRLAKRLNLIRHAHAARPNGCTPAELAPLRTLP